MLILSKPLQLLDILRQTEFFAPLWSGFILRDNFGAEAPLCDFFLLFHVVSSKRSAG